MTSTFSRTLRSLNADGPRRWAMGLIPSVVLLTAWSAWFFGAEVSVWVTSERALLVVDLEAHPVAAPVTGRVATVRVVLGQAVAAGEALLELESFEQRSRVEEERARRAGLSLEVAALRQQVTALQRALEDSRQAAVTSLEERRAGAAAAEEAALLAEQEADRQARLLASGLTSASEAGRARSEASQRRSAAESLQRGVESLGWSLSSAEGERLARIAELRRGLAEAERDVASTAAAVRRLESALELRTVRAPIAGRVGELAPVRPGAVVAPGERLGAVVPEGDLKIVADFEPAAALGRIRPEQHAQLRLSGFPSTRFGTVPASVTRVANETRDGRIRVHLAPARGPGAPAALPLQHGLPGTVEIQVERVSPAVLLLRTVGQVLDRPAGGPGDPRP